MYLHTSRVIGQTLTSIKTEYVLHGEQLNNI